MRVSASFLACRKIYPAIEKLNVTDVDYIHVDFIDGSFVKGKKIPFRKLKKIDKYTAKRLDVHLMTRKVVKYIKKFASLNIEFITLHVEAVDDVSKCIKLIHNYGMKCGIALSPNTDIDVIKPYLKDIDMVLVMSVEPGYGGQKFIPEVVEKIKNLRQIIKREKLKLLISVDGGINNDNVVELKNIPVDIIVAGSYITKGDDYQKQIDSLR